MQDPVKYLKDQYLSVLSGAISYNGSEVPVYDYESDPAGSDYYITVTTSTAVQLDNQKNRFNTEATVLIDITARLDYRISGPSKIVDAIADKVLQVVLISPNESALQPAGGLYATGVKLESSNDLDYTDGGQKRIARRLLRFSQTIIQQ